jgi:hypothetical protein
VSDDSGKVPNEMPEKIKNPGFKRALMERLERPLVAHKAEPADPDRLHPIGTSYLFDGNRTELLQIHLTAYFEPKRVLLVAVRDHEKIPNDFWFGNLLINTGAAPPADKRGVDFADHGESARIDLGEWYPMALTNDIGLLVSCETDPPASVESPVTVCLAILGKGKP